MCIALRERLKEAFALSQPGNVAIEISPIAQTLAAEFERGGMAIALPQATPISHDWVFIPTSVHPSDWALPQGVPHTIVDRERFLLPPNVEILDITADLLLSIPDLFDVFSKLAFPGHAGKAYVEARTVKGDTTTSLLPPLKETKPRCKHGLPKHLCVSCTEGDKRATSDRVHTSLGTPRVLDVFDLLLPYLQPPIESLLANTALFPSNRRPYRFQVDGIHFLVQHKSALLGDEMGLGKTMQAIIALQVLFRRGEIRRVLIVCRRSLLNVWETELSKWAPELFFVKVRGTREERAWLWKSPAPIYLTTYETLRQDVHHRMDRSRRQFDVIILDEIQEIKNPHTKKSRAVRQLQARYRWGLSGTPIENNLAEVVAIFDYLHPSLFQGVTILSPYFVREKIRPYILRRRTAEVLRDLPEKRISEIWLELSPRQRISYEREYHRARSHLSQIGVTRVHVFEWLNKLKQICNLDPETGESCKVDYLIDELESVTEAGQKALVFSQFPNVTLRRIQDRLRRFDPAIFDGSLNDNERTYFVRAFQEQASPKVLLVSVKTGGQGLTLTRANHVFHFDHWWNPAVARQAEGRAHRIGQTQVVFVYDLYTKGTIEERIYELLKRKEALFQFVIDDLSEKGVQRLITDEELFALFDLKPPPRSDGNQLNRHNPISLSEQQTGSSNSAVG